MEMRKVRLGDICRFINGRAYSQPELLDNGKYKVLRVGNIFDGNHWYYSDLELEEDKYCNEGDLLYSWACTFGPYIWHGPKTIYHYHIWKVEQNDSFVDKSFLYYFLNYQTKGFMGSTHGSTMIHITKENMENFEVLLPSLPHQKKIAAVLSALDNKIALNKKMNQKLEAMAKRLYDYWFVQFDFPDENGRPYKTSGGPMVYNETLKREIPVGWEVVPLKSCIKHINTGLNPRDNFVLGNGDIKYVTVKNLTTEGNIDFSGCDFIDEEALKKVHKRSDIAKGDVLYASICPLGRSFLINKDPEGWDINESVFSIRPCHDVISSEFLSMYLKDSAVVEKASKMATGSIFKGIRIKELENMILAVPPKKIMEVFSTQIKNLIDLEHKNMEQISRLITLRDKLLPLLMNGQVEVK